MRFEKRVALMVVGIVAALHCGCAGTYVSKYAYDDGLKTNVPVKDGNCYDASILLGVPAKRAKDIAEKVIAAVDATIEENGDTSIKAQRNRHIGLFVGSGGEELVVNLQAVGNDRTYVTITTKTGFVGGAGQRAWSCEIVDKMAAMAARN